MSKQRLIDADALKQHFADMQKYERCACNFVDDGGDPATEWYCVEDALENTPTIDAIPMDWLDAQIHGYASALKSTELGALLVVKRLWKKEQEAQK